MQRRALMYSALPIKRRNVAMILHGCGVYDGSEIYETTSMLIHLSKQKVNVSMFAPDKNQMHVINHLDGKPMSEIRNILTESARLARGNIAPLRDLDVDKFDALFIPGGFGAAKNLSDFALKNAECTVIPEVESVLKKFHSLKKPIGLCCIAPVLAARCLPGVELTMGGDIDQNGRWPYAEASAVAKQMGAKMIPKDMTEIHVDEVNKIVTTPAFMCGVTTLADVFDGIGNLVEAAIRI
ncbi:ES1 protein like protein mitochondrial [Paragonimus heterotremus]|uniref:ES1 protein like protein mitochondrial n=1 Tax=Paragonimus heterotremus TaxID=100268 RepID=A0A8J4THG7_9TREM|nr:ES1 protein like protein mitochondrial [Paragonimus heterotremus]